jgi:hypothetical protein
MSRLTFTAAPETCDEDTITTRQLFRVVMALMERMERMELVAGNLANVVLCTLADEDPPQDKFEAACAVLEDFLRDLKEEIDARQQIRVHLDFLDQAE